MSDNHHVYCSPSQMSCGVLELSKLSSDPEKVLYAIATNLYHPSRGSSYAFVMWSDTEESNGVKLRDLLDGMQLGPVIESNWDENPKTGNLISVWLWNLNHETFKEWYVKTRVEKAKKL